MPPANSTTSSLRLNYTDVLTFPADAIEEPKLSAVVYALPPVFASGFDLLKDAM